jgi:ABC-2 type transport system ATP-binding protein
VSVINHGQIIEVSTPQQLGGRSTSKAVVQWRDNGEIKSEETENPTALVSTLTAQFSGEIPELSVTRPSLEDIYLKMIGRADE